MIAIAILLGHADCAGSALLLLLVECTVAVVGGHEGLVESSGRAVLVDVVASIGGLLLGVEGLGQGSTVESGAVLLAMGTTSTIVTKRYIQNNNDIFKD